MDLPVHQIHTAKRTRAELDLGGMRELLTSHTYDHVFIEQVAASPNGAREPQAAHRDRTATIRAGKNVSFPEHGRQPIHRSRPEPNLRSQHRTSAINRPRRGDTTAATVHLLCPLGASLR
jgi:hypothetical protein